MPSTPHSHDDFAKEYDIELQGVIDGIDHGIAMIHTSFVAHYLNQMMSSLFWQKKSTLDFTQKCYQTLYGFSTPCTFCPFRDSEDNLVPPQKGNFHSQQDITLYETDQFGEKKVFFHNIHTLVDYKGRLYIIEILKDITQDKRVMEERLRIEKLAALGTVVQSVAHDLQNPLTGMSFILQKMLAEKYDEKTKKNLSMLAKDLQLISSIVADLHSVHRHETYFLEPLSLKATILSAHQDATRNRHVVHKTHFNWDCDENILVMGSERQLHQVFVNLFSNTLDAFSNLPPDEKSRAAIWFVIRKEFDSSFEKNKTVLKVQLIDNGGGIPEHRLARVFDPYFTTKKESLSMGLGLHVVNKIMDEHAGKIEVDSNGIFTRFSLSFLLQDSDEKRYSGSLYDRF